MTINDENNTEPRDPFIIEMEPSDELTELVTSPPALLPGAAATEQQADPPAAADPEFDAYLAVVKLLIGGTIEGANELTKRLEQWEAAQRTAADAPPVGEINTNGDVARYLLVGMALSTTDGLRRQALKLVQASDVFWRMTGSATQPLVNNRLTGIIAGPIDRAIDRLALRGQKRVNDWIELGRTQEPNARRMARETYDNVFDEFIGLLAENQELADLVQKKSMGLATEAVDEFRSRTVSADALAEKLVRRILRRPMREELLGSSGGGQVTAEGE
ncbi:MAG TPA: hypothetical protein PK205_13935 [Promineifilum sp.]|nr:hypothetical protein [Promineifilum sp.]HRO91196.1 hypothetical protein [Promineifilum sp.]HRQ14399.1 hypothetical protein [Promineifilum sp.]